MESDRDHWGSMTPGRVITAEALAAAGHTPRVLLKNDFGIAAIKYHRPLSEAAQEELDNLNSDGLDRLSKVRLYSDGQDVICTASRASTNPFYVGRTSAQGMHNDGIKLVPSNVFLEASTCLKDFFESAAAYQVYGEFWTKQRGFLPHFDTKLTGHWHLSRHHGMRVYSSTKGRLSVITLSEDVDREQLAKLVERGHATYEDLVAGDLYHFNSQCVHESATSLPYGARPVRFVMKLIS